MEGDNPEIKQINTIPLPNLTSMMNNFIANTATHLNKLSTKGDEKLQEFDEKLNDLDIMITLLESKLESLPESIKSEFPPLEQLNLDDIVQPIVKNDTGIIKNDDEEKEENGNEDNQGNNKEEPPQQTDVKVEQDQNGENNEEEKKEEVKNNDGEEMSPEEELQKFLKEHENFNNLYKVLKMGVPIPSVKNKAKINGMDLNLLDDLIRIAHKVDPKISLE